MLELFGKDRATGAAAQTTKEINRHRVETIEEIDEMISNTEIRLDNVNSGDDQSVQLQLIVNIVSLIVKFTSACFTVSQNASSGI